jgi:hypothetical protein
MPVPAFSREMVFSYLISSPSKIKDLLSSARVVTTWEYCTIDYDKREEQRWSFGCECCIIR